MDKSTLKNYKLILIIFLAAITIFSVFKYVYLLREKYALLNSLNTLKLEIAALDNQNQNLLKELEKEKEEGRRLDIENSFLKANLKAGIKKIDRLNAEFARAKDGLEKLNAELQALKGEKDNLEAQLTEVAQERDNLKVRLTSAAELRNALKELRRQVRNVGQEIKHKVEAQEAAEGNRGFVIKDGKPTYRPRVKIEVVPATESSK